MGNLVNITAGGAFAPQTDAPAPPAISGMSFGFVASADQDFINQAVNATNSFFIPIFVPSKRFVDAFVIVAGSTNLTNDLELSLYNIDTTGVILGTKIVGATQTASFSGDTYTEITFTSTEVDEGWYWIGVSGISASAGPNLNAWDTKLAGAHLPSPVDGFGVDGGWDTFGNVGYFTTAVQLDTVAVGAALTATQVNGSSAGILIIRLRNT